MADSDTDSDASLPGNPYLTTKSCIRCKKSKPIVEFNAKKTGGITKNCKRCCAHMVKYVSKYGKSAKGKKTKQRYWASPLAAVTRERHRSTELFAETTAKYRNSSRRKELRQEEYDRIHNDPGRHLEHAIGSVIARMLKGSRNTSKKLKKNIGISSAEELTTHFKSTFQPGMTMENHGKHVIGQPRRWNIGHRIARDHYDPNNEEDMRRCWNLDNLFAQWGDENIRAKTRLPEESELLKLKHCWPTAWC